MSDFLPNTAGLQEYTSEELLLELTYRIKTTHIKNEAVKQIYDDYLCKRITPNETVSKLYDIMRYQ